MASLKRDYLRLALQRVITESGIAANPHQGMHGVTIVGAWEKAKKQGLLRPVTPQEVKAHLEHQRAVRAVLLGMLELSALDECVSVTWESHRPAVAEITDALVGVCSEIEAMNRQHVSFWTLTEAGVEYLGVE